MSQQIITINGVRYDATTGLRIDEPAVAAKKPAVTPSQVRRMAKSSADIHARTQRSETLNRRVAAKHTHTVRPDIARPTAARPGKHPLVSKFGADVAPVKTRQLTKNTELITPTTPDIAPQSHPHLQKVTAAKAPATHVRATSANLSAKQIKERSLTNSLKKAPAHNSSASARRHKAKKTSRLPRVLSIASASLAILLLAGYFTYINMPNISVRVAAAQAGINASYPGYRPDGYNLSGPIAYNTGQVSMKFASTSGPQNYTVTQTRSSWDSSAVEQNYAEAKWGNDVNTVQASGLTIYQNGSNAAWVNGGILYTISGNAPLSSSQITQLATSM